MTPLSASVILVFSSASHIFVLPPASVVYVLAPRLIVLLIVVIIDSFNRLAAFLFDVVGFQLLLLAFNSLLINLFCFQLCNPY
jgi:hypothetical protein